MIDAIANLIIICAFFGGLFVLLGLVELAMVKIFWRNRD